MDVIRDQKVIQIKGLLSHLAASEDDNNTDFSLLLWPFVSLGVVNDRLDSSAATVSSNNIAVDVG